MRKHSVKKQLLTLIMVLAILSLAACSNRNAQNSEAPGSSMPEPPSQAEGDVDSSPESESVPADSVTMEVSMGVEGTLTFKVPKVFENKLAASAERFIHSENGEPITSIRLHIIGKENKESVFDMIFMGDYALEHWGERPKPKEILSFSGCFLGYWPANGNPFGDERDSDEFKLMEQHGLELQECIINSMLWTRPGYMESFAIEIRDVYADDVVKLLNQWLDEHRSGTFEEMPNHHPAYPADYPPASNLPVIESIDDVAILWREAVPIDENTELGAGIFVVVPIDETHLYVLEPDLFSDEDNNVSIGFGYSGFESMGLDEFIEYSGTQTWKEQGENSRKAASAPAPSSEDNLEQPDPTLPENQAAGFYRWDHTEYKKFGDISTYRQTTLELHDYTAEYAGRQAEIIRATMLLPQNCVIDGTLSYDGNFVNGTIKIGDEPSGYYRLKDGETIKANGGMDMSFDAFTMDPLTGEAYEMVETRENQVGGYYQTPKFMRYIGQGVGLVETNLLQYVIAAGDGIITQMYFYVSPGATAEDLEIYDAIANSVNVAV